MKTITLARKPIIGTVAANVIEHGSGGLNIDASRIGNGEDRDIGGRSLIRTESSIGYGSGSAELSGVKRRRPTGGRFPANLILQHLEGCEQDGIKRVKSHNPDNKVTQGGASTGGCYGDYGERSLVGHADKDGKEAVANWVCEPSCPVARLDEQTGELGNNHRASKANGSTSIWGSGSSSPVDSISDTGGASRFFKQVKT